MVYQWKVPIFSIPAQEAGAELERIKQERGRLLPEDVVDESRDSASVLHDCFEWDDRTAAEKYRTSQAHKIINTIITVVESEEGPVSVRAFVSIGDTYEPIRKVLSIPDMYDQFHSDARRELTQIRQKYQSIEKLHGVMTEIDKFLST